MATVDTLAARLQTPRPRSPSPVLIAAGLIAALAIAAFIAIELSVLHAGFRDYDEGVYWQSLRAMARGEALFGQIFASQPPAFYFAMLPFYVLGHSIAGLRLGVAVFAALGLVATYTTARLVAGTTAGLLAVGLLATSSLWIQQGAVLQADAPAAAMSVIALALLIAATKAPAGNRLWLGAASGFCLAIAIGMKLSGAVVVLPFAFYLVPYRNRSLALEVGAGLLVGVAALAIPVLQAPQAAYQDLVHSHVAAGQSLHRVLGANLRLLLFKRDLPIEALAVVSAVMAIAGRELRILPFVAWAAASAVAILLYQPLFPHHLVMLFPALALVSGIGLARVARAGAGPALAALAISALVAVLGLDVAIGDARSEIHAGAHEAQLAASLRALTTAGDFVITDNPYAAALADRAVPGPLVDQSRQRIAAGLLTVNDVDRTTAAYRVKWILVDGDRLVGIPGFQGWLAAHYSVAAQLNGGAVLYRKN